MDGQAMQRQGARQARAEAAYRDAVAAEVAAREAFVVLEDAQARTLYFSAAERDAAIQARRDAEEAVYIASARSDAAGYRAGWSWVSACRCTR